MRKTRAKDINEKSTWQELTLGGEIYEPATSKLVNTGEWRVNRPVLHEEKCKNCMMCFLYCPDSSVVVRNEKMQCFDLMHCKGCGICSKVCPFGAIEMVKEG